MLHEWEEVATDTYRMKVFCGWIYRYTRSTMGGEITSSMVFVPE